MTGPEWTPQPVAAPPSPGPEHGPSPGAPADPAFVGSPAPATVRVPGLDPAQAADDAEAQANLDLDAEGDDEGAGRPAGLAALLGRLFRRRPAAEVPDADSDADAADPASSDAPAGADPAGDESDVADPPRMRSWRPSTWGWETRVGLAAVLSFLILIGVFVSRRGGSPIPELDPPKHPTPKVQIPNEAPPEGDKPSSEAPAPTPAVAPTPTPAVAQAEPTPRVSPPTPKPDPTVPPAQAPGPDSEVVVPPVKAEVLTPSDAAKRAVVAEPSGLPGIDPTTQDLPPLDGGKEPIPFPSPTTDAPKLPTDPTTGPESATTDPIAKPTTESAANPTAEPMANPTAEPMANPTAEPAIKPTAEPASPAEQPAPALGEDRPPVPNPAPTTAPPDFSTATGADPVRADPVRADLPPPSPAADPVAAPAPTVPAAPDPATTGPAPSDPVRPQPLGPSEKPVLDPVPTGDPGVAAGSAIGSGSVVIPNSGRRPGGIRVDDPEDEDLAGAPGRRPVPDGPAVRDEPSPGANRTGESLYKVKPNENLYTISRDWYGSSRYYKALHEANKDQVPDIRTLYIGTVLRIPRPENLDPTLIEPPAVGEPSDGPAVSRASTAQRGGDPEPEFPSRRSIRAAPRKSKSAAPEPRRPTYRVARANETLRSIARDTLGDSTRAGEILDLNREQVESLRSPLQPNMTLTLPEDAVPSRRPR